MKSFPFEQFRENAISEGRSLAFIESCVKYGQFLESRDYPVLFSLQHLAIAMGVQSNFLKHLTNESKSSIEMLSSNFNEIKYNHFFLKKRSGGYREIMSPHKDLKYIQKWILFNILSKFPLEKCCTGFRTGISIKDNAIVHSYADKILKVDLLKFYDTITQKRVYGVFQSMGYAKNLSYSLAKICTGKHNDKYWIDFTQKEKEMLSFLFETRPAILPQGSPSSPMLANIVATRLDKRFSALAQKMDFSYSRYADDLTFSVGKEGCLPPLKLIREIISNEEFYINENKITYMNKGSKQYVTGLTVTNGVHTSKKHRKKIGRHIYFCRKFGVEDHLEKHHEQFPGYGVLQFHDWLYGHICFINSIDKEYSNKLLNDFNKISWFI